MLNREGEPPGSVEEKTLPSRLHGEDREACGDDVEMARRGWLLGKEDGKNCRGASDQGEEGEGSGRWHHKEQRER